ncbi:MAG: lipopolysaccharide assembly protein LapB [Pseudomonadota bacterium]
MDFDWQWLLLGLPVAFALGWIGSRIDLRQWKREQKSSPKAYYKGLNLLLNEQQDKAIDAFIEAVQGDPDTTELHFALGNLFRRRGEVERAVRVHQHLMQRADLSAAERERAQNALAQDYLKAGLFDRAEAAYRALEGSPFDTEARLALLQLHERSRDWRAAADDAAKLESAGAGSFASRIAHHWCELALEAEARGDNAETQAALARARETAPTSPRPWVQSGEYMARAGQHAEALAAWAELHQRHRGAFNLVAEAYAKCAQSAGQTSAALTMLEATHAQQQSLDLLKAIDLLDNNVERSHQRHASYLANQPGLSAAAAVLRDAPTPQAGVIAAIESAAKPLQRYRCAACSFEAQHYFWQCPGCLTWDSYPPQRVEDM